MARARLMTTLETMSAHSSSSVLRSTPRVAGHSERGERQRAQADDEVDERRADDELDEDHEPGQQGEQAEQEHDQRGGDAAGERADGGDAVHEGADVGAEAREDPVARARR